MAEVKPKRVSLKELTDEEKKARKAEKMREYMKNRRNNDPEFAEKQREYNRRRKNERYRTDEEYREKTKLYYKEKGKENKNYKLKYEELLKNIG